MSDSKTSLTNIESPSALEVVAGSSKPKKKRTDEEILTKLGYTLGKFLGEGTYAKVVYAEYNDKTIGKTVPLACKVITLKNASESFVKKFFPRELAILCKLEHPNIIRVHSVLKETEKYYLFITLCGNGDLLDFIQSHGAVREAQARTWFKEMLDAVEYLHKMDVVHRDLKCENIFLTSSFVVKVGDFGFTRDFKEGDDLSKTYCGSVMYAPPEVVRSIPYNPKMADVWSLGVILFVMINSALPFDQSKGLTKLYNDQINRSWMMRDQVKKIISSELKLLMYNLLEPAPEKRFTVTQLKRNPWVLMTVKKSIPGQMLGRAKSFLSS